MLSTKSTLVLVALMLCGTILSAQTKKKVKIDHATIFLKGAELESTAKVDLRSGETEILFTNIAGNVNQQSLNVNATNGAVVQSAIFQNNYLADDNLSPQAQVITDSIDYLDKQKTNLNTELQVVNEQISVLSQNRKVSGEQNGLSVTELQKMLALVKTQMQELLKERNGINEKTTKINKRIAKLNQQLQEEKQKGYQPGGQLLVKFYSTKTTTSEITITYVVPNAGWSPSYDIRVDKVNSPVNIAYKAHVYQNSGVAWDKIKLTLSTGNPNEGAQAPTLNPWYLNFNRPVIPTYSYNTNNNPNTGQRVITSDQLEKLPTRNTTSMVSTTGATYQSANGSAVSIGGARGSGTLYYVDGVQVVGSRGVNLPQDAIDQVRTSGTPAKYNSSINNYTQVSNTGVNSRFDIELAYTIPSDGKTHNVAIKKHQLPATYRYFAVPKLDRDAFLQAQVTDWENLNLLPGPTNIFYEDTYVGQGQIDMRGVKDTMNISLGRDKKVIIQRERDKNMRSVRTIGSNVRETFVYTTSIRNTRNEPIDITILDQFPISTENSIHIEDMSSEGAELDKTTGKLTWQLNVQPNTTDKLQVGFTIKYPKGREIYFYR